jgi:hypothetical protein
MSTLAEAVRRTLPPIIDRLRNGFHDFDEPAHMMRQLEHLLDLADEEGRV